MSTYDDLKALVNTAQAERVALRVEGKPIDHDSLCSCEGCLKERELRRTMESMPEHAEAQRSWVVFMKDLREAAEYPEEPLNEFNMFGGVIA